MSRPPRVERHEWGTGPWGPRRGGRPWLHGAAAALGVAALVALLLLAVLLVWDLVVGNWLGLPLDVVFGAFALATLVFARRAMRRYR